MGLKVMILLFAAIMVLIWLLGTFLPIDKFIEKCGGRRITLPDGFCEDENQDITEMEKQDDKTLQNMETNGISPLEKRFVDTLHQMGCKIENQKDGNIFFQYQGEWFIVYTMADSFWAAIKDPSWYRVPLDDIDEMALVRKTINEQNWNDTIKYVYWMDEEKKEMYVETLFQFLAMPEIKQFDEYLKLVFRMFFIAKHDFKARLDSNRNRNKA